MKKHVCTRMWFLFFVLIACVVSNKPLYSQDDSDHYPQKINDLVAGKYYGAFRLSYHAGEYLDRWFGLSPHVPGLSLVTSTWVTVPGQYNDLRGYWIFLANFKLCWKAEHANGPLTMWNEDGKAKGNPEDWELFVFEFANDQHTEVIVRNIYGRYVRYDSSKFICDADRANAASFVPIF